MMKTALSFTQLNCFFFPILSFSLSVYIIQCFSFNDKDQDPAMGKE